MLQFDLILINAHRTVVASFLIVASLISELLFFAIKNPSDEDGMFGSLMFYFGSSEDMSHKLCV